MKKKQAKPTPPCRSCGAASQVSTCMVFSTLGLSDRKQKGVPAGCYCISCLQGLIERGQHLLVYGFDEAVNAMQIALTNIQESENNEAFTNAEDVSAQRSCASFS